MKSTILMLLLATAAHSADTLPAVFQCGKPGVAGGLAAGVDMTKFTVDTTRFPEAICNDGTPAVFYFAPSTRAEDRNRWLIFLQGGGSCTSGQACAQRWCSIDTNYGMDKMTSSLTKAQIRGNGFLDVRDDNRFSTWNRVLIFYCSSDGWAGTKTSTQRATLPDGTEREYLIHFKGSRIIDAVLDTLRNAGPPRRRATRHDAGTEAAAPWPDLDEATNVLFAGSSAGGNGVRQNADRVGAKLRSTNPKLTDYRALFDAAYSPLRENLDFTHSTGCISQPTIGCSYTTATQFASSAGDIALYGTRGDESCLAWHSSVQPGTEWRCSDNGHVIMHHITTPFFLHQDEQDSNIGGSFVEDGFGSASDYGTKVEAELS
ncbi:MAG TPA: pectin acetylesterase-family hydrolase, partial [Thermoanaerobaculia bacterium]|nr:pectin acetylesterase-family hydrolase [Thermoanaerobaculia bacterium]